MASIPFPLLELPLELLHSSFYPLLDVVECILLYGTCSTLRREVAFYVRDTQIRTATKNPTPPMGTSVEVYLKTMVELLDRKPMPKLLMHTPAIFLSSFYAKHIGPALTTTWFRLDAIQRMYDTFGSNGYIFDNLFLRHRLREMVPDAAFKLIDWMEGVGLIRATSGREKFAQLVRSGRVPLLLRRFPPETDEYTYWANFQMEDIIAAIGSESVPMFYCILAHWKRMPKMWPPTETFLVTHMLHEATISVAMFRAVASVFHDQITTCDVAGIARQVLEPTWEKRGNGPLWDAIVTCALVPACGLLTPGFGDALMKMSEDVSEMAREAKSDIKPLTPVTATFPIIELVLVSFVNSIARGYRAVAIDWLVARNYLTQQVVTAMARPSTTSINGECYEM